MNNDHCLYCGSSDIIPVDEEHYLEQNLHILQCRQCRVMFTELEQRMEADSTPLDYKPDFDVSDEEVTLDAVWKQWDELWHHNLELLFQHKHPLKHPVEFMVYRDLWQVLDASYNYRLLTPDKKNYDHLYASEHLLAMLINNLRQIEYFLSSYTEEQRLRAMQRLYEALSGLRREKIFVGIFPGGPENRISSQQNDFATSIYQQRLDAIIALAEQLEDMYEAGHGPEYLKMAGRLWHKCTGTGRMYDEGSGLIFSTQWIIYLPEKRRKDIAEKVSAISKKIHKIEPDFRMAEPVSRNWKKLLPWGCGVIYILLVIVVTMALDDLLGEYGNKLPDNDPKKFFAVIFPMIFPFISIVVVFDVICND